MVLVMGDSGSVIVVGRDGERSGLVRVLAAVVAATATSLARLTTPATAAAAPTAKTATAVHRRFGHRARRMAVDQPDARAHGRLFHFLGLLLDSHEHGLPEETTFFGLCRRGGRVVRRCRLF